MDPRYSWFNPSYVRLRQERDRAVLRLLARHVKSSLAGQRILDAGCGTGQWIRQFVEWGARPEYIVGIDVLPDRIGAARRMCAPGVQLRVESAARIASRDAAFDIVVQSTVLSSILDDAAQRAVARELLRVLKPDGILVWYDLRVGNPHNPNVMGIGRRRLRRLFEGCEIRIRRITLAPPLARLLAGRSTLLLQLAGAVPLLRTHYVGVVRHGGQVAGLPARSGEA